jgi:hypothetical protein
MVLFRSNFTGWDEKFCLSKPHTTEGPRTTTKEARTREGILYNYRLNLRVRTEVFQSSSVGETFESRPVLHHQFGSILSCTTVDSRGFLGEKM